MAGSIVLNTHDGVQLHVPRGIDQITCYVLLEQDDWFEDEIRFVRALLRPAQRAVDIGANHGVYTAAMADAVGSAGAVWAFEPTPQTDDLLARSLAGLAQVRLLPSAVSNAAGTAQLRMGAESEGNALAAGAATDASRGPDERCGSLKQALDLALTAESPSLPALMSRSPMTERRRQLVRMRAGLQAGPERHPLLETASDGNLNPAYWRGEC